MTHDQGMDVIKEISHCISETIEPVLINDSPSGHTFLASSKGQEIIDFDPHDALLKYLDDKNTNELFTMVKEITNNDTDDHADEDVQEVLTGLHQVPDYHKLTFDLKLVDLTYNLENLEFNLQPNRAEFYGDILREVVTTFATNSDDKDFIEKLIAILNRPCERQSDCAFLQHFFPHVNRPGTVCYSVGVESLITCAPQAIVSKIDYSMWISILQNAFFPELHEKEFTPRTPELNICICCLLLQQAKIPIEAQNDSCLLIRVGTPVDGENRIVHFINGEGKSSMQYDTFSESFNIHGHKTYKIEFPFYKYVINNDVVTKIM